MTKIQLRRDTLANFTSVNPVLAEGEMAYETDTKKFKIGDGTTAYTSLDYQGGGGTTITKGESTYTTLALGDNLVVTDGVVNVNLDEIGSELGDLSARVTTAEEEIAHKQDLLTAGDGISIVKKYANELEKVYYDGSGNVLTDVSNYEVKYGQRNNLFIYDDLNLSNKFEFSVRVPTSVLKAEKNHLVINFSSTISNSISGEIGVQILKTNSGLTYQMGLMSRNTNWRTNSTFSYDSVPDYFDVTVTRADKSTKTLHFKFQCPLDTTAYEFDWDDGNSTYGGLFPLNTSGLHLMIAIGWGDPFYGDFSNVNFSYDNLGELKTTISSTVEAPTKTSELVNDSGFVTANDSPILDVPVNNCVLAMPTVPTFDGTNVKVYTGTKVAIPNGLNTDGTCKSNIVTLTADTTINQSTFNGDITLMLKSNGTIDQTAYSYFKVDDISTIETLTAYCWYYDRKTNNHYLASSAGAKQGPYQRIKIGSYNQAEAATTKYFKTYKPIALEKLDITDSCIPDYTTRRQGVTDFDIWKTVTYDCWVSISSLTTSGNRILYLLLKDEKGTTIQGVTDNNAIMRAQQANSNCMNQVFAYIPKGYSYKATIDSDQNFYSSYEYPLKGGFN